MAKFALEMGSGIETVHLLYSLSAKCVEFYSYIIEHKYGQA